MGSRKRQGDGINKEGRGGSRVREDTHDSQLREMEREKDTERESRRNTNKAKAGRGT